MGIINSDKMFRSYSDLNFGFTFLEHNVIICTQNVWSLRRQNYVNYPIFTEYFVITWLGCVQVKWDTWLSGTPIDFDAVHIASAF